MEFLNPTALFGLLALPLLLLPYLIRRKPRRLVFSSLLLFMDAGEHGEPPSLGPHSLALDIFFAVADADFVDLGAQRTDVFRAPNSYRYRPR